MSLYFDKNTKIKPSLTFHNTYIKEEVFPSYSNPEKDINICLYDYLYFIQSLYSSIIDNKIIKVVEPIFNKSYNDYRILFGNIVSVEISEPNIESITVKMLNSNTNNIESLNIEISNFIPRQIDQSFDTHYINPTKSNNVNNLYKFQVL